MLRFEGMHLLETGGYSFLKPNQSWQIFMPKQQIAKGTNSIAKWTNSIAKVTTSTAKMMNSIAKTCNIGWYILKYHSILTLSTQSILTSLSSRYCTTCTCLVAKWRGVCPCCKKTHHLFYWYVQKFTSLLHM